MPHAKPVLFVDDQQPEIAQLHLALQLVGADQDIDFAFRGLLEDLRLLFSAAEAESISMRTGQLAKRSRKLS